MGIMHSVTIYLFVVFMYLDMVLTLIAWLSPRSKEANIFLGSLFRKNIVMFWIVGTTLKTVLVYLIMSLYSILPNAGLLMMCFVGGGGFTVCIMNFMMVLPSLWNERVRQSFVTNPLGFTFKGHFITKDVIPITVMVEPRRIRAAPSFQEPFNRRT